MKVQCPSCEARLNVDDKYAGKQANCPKCKSPMMLPAAPPPTAKVIPEAALVVDEPAPPLAHVPVATGAELRVECPECRHSLKVQPDALGRKGNCPKCGFKLTIQPDLELAQPYSFAVGVRPTFPSMCVGCLAPNPAQGLNLRTDPAAEPKPSAAGGSTIGAILGGIVGGVLLGETGAAIGAGIGAGGGAVAAKIGSPTPVRIPICDRCLGRLGEDDRTALGERNRDAPRVRLAFLQRDWIDATITFRFAHPVYGQAFLGANPGVVSTSAGVSGGGLLINPPGPFPEFLRALLDELMPHNKSAGWYRGKDIPEKKLNNAIAAYADSVSPRDVLGVADETLLGSGKTGFLVHEGGLAFKTQSGSGHVRWGTVTKAEFAGGVLSSSVTVTSSGPVRTITCAAPCKPLMEPLCKLVNQVALYQKLKQANALPTRFSASALAADLLFNPPGAAHEFLVKLLNHLMPHDAASKWYRPPEIPDKKVANAISAYADGVEDIDALGLADDTVFGSGKGGFLVTADAIYFAGNGSKGSTTWDDVKKAEHQHGVLTSSVVITLLDGRTVTLNSTAPVKTLLESLTKVVTQMALYHRLQREDALPTGTAAGLPPAAEVLDEPPAAAVPKWKQKMGTAVGSGAPAITGKPRPTNSAGRCPKCEFDYGWDGRVCSHCGHVS